MPAQQIAINAENIVAIILALVVWAWQKMEKTQDKLETAFIDFVKENDSVHDKLFTAQRDSDKQLNGLLGEHKINHKSQGG
jgi:hypothetical protein